jgi:hypothetical protein
VSLGRTARAPLGWLAAVLLLAAYVAFAESRDFPNQLGADLYHPWAIALVRDDPAGLRNPYVEPAAYGARFNTLATQPGASPKMFAVGRFWQIRSADKFEPTATPFLYASLGFLPADFDRAHLVWVVLQFIAVGAAVYGLARMQEVARLPAAALALGVLGTFMPFIYDVGLGNVASSQLAFLVALLYVSVKGLYLRHPWVDRLYLGALVLFMLFKPNMAWVALAMALHYGAVRGMRPFVTGIGVAAIVAVLAFACGAWYFRDAGIWGDWIAYTRGSHGGTLLYSVYQGNQSFPIRLAQRLPVLGPGAYSVILTIALAGALAFAACAWGKRLDARVPALRRALADPWFAMSAGIVFTVAASPLVWYHYYLLTLIPIAWLLRRPERGTLSAACALVSYCAMAMPLLRGLSALGSTEAIDLATYYPWVPLVAGLVMHAARASRDSP